MKATQKQIDGFLQEKRLAIAGVSRNPTKFGYITFKELTERGYTVIPINPLAESIDNIKCYSSVLALPDDVESLLIMTPRETTDEILRDAIEKGIKHIWVQQSSETIRTLKIAEEYQQEIIFNKCIFMFAEPVAGFHKFHRTLVKIFGGLPK